MSTHRAPAPLSIQSRTKAVFLGDCADCSLRKFNELGAGRKNKAILCNRGVAPEFLDWALDAVEGDFHIGIGARLVVGELDSGSRSPSSLRGRSGESGDGEEGTSKCGGVDKLHLVGFEACV